MGRAEAVRGGQGGGHPAAEGGEGGGQRGGEEGEGVDCGGERGGDLGVADTEERGSRAEEEEARRIALFRYRSGLGLRAWGLIRLKIRASG